MRISLLHKSVFVNWRRITIIGHISALREAGAGLTKAGVPYILGSYYPGESSMAKERNEEAVEVWLLVEAAKYSAACSILFPLPEAREECDRLGEPREAEG